MKHNFSRELACFNLAQQIIEDLLVLNGEQFISIEVDGKKIDHAFIKFIGRDASEGELNAVVFTIIEFGPSLQSDCATFGLAHELFHIVED